MNDIISNKIGLIPIEGMMLERMISKPVDASMRWLDENGGRS